MATYVLIPGAACDPQYWYLLAAELRQRGHDPVAVDLPCEDDAAGLTEYVDAVVEAIGARTDVILVAHSFGGFTAPLVRDRVRVDLLVMLSAMIPAPGEAPGDWWGNTGYEAALQHHADQEGYSTTDVNAMFYADLPADLAAEAAAWERDQSGTPMEKPWPRETWPDVPTKFLLCRDDRFFPAEFMRRVVRKRLGITPDEMPGGHMVMLARPKELADRLEAYRAEL